MADVEFNVVAHLKVEDGAAMARTGRVGKGANDASKAFDSLGRSASNGMAMIGSAAGGAVDSIVKTGMALAAATAVGAGAVGLKAIKTGLIDINAKTEEAENGFATIFNMLGATPTFDAGLKEAKGLMAGIRADAAALPGETKDFVAMAQTISAPLLNAGKSIDYIRKATADTVVSTASLLGTSTGKMQQGAREMAGLLEGHAGGHNILGLRLGINAHTQVNGKQWSKASSAERADYLAKTMSKAKESLPAFEKSWSGLTTTLIDKGKALLGSATQPLFSKMKGSMGWLATYLDAHKYSIEQIANTVGGRLGRAWDWLFGRVRNVLEHSDRWIDRLTRARDIAVQFGQELYGAYQKAEPYLAKFGGFLARQLEHPKKLALELAAIKAGSMAISAAPAMLSVGANVATAFSTTGLLGAKGAATAATAGGAGAAAGTGTSALSALSAALGPLLVVVAAVVGIFDNMTRAYGALSPMFDIFKGSQEMVNKWLGGSFVALLEQLKSTFTNLWVSVRPLIDLMGVGIVVALNAAIRTIWILIKPLEWLASAIRWVLSKIPGWDNPDKANGGMIAGARTAQQTYLDPNAVMASIAPDKKIDDAWKAFDKSKVEKAPVVDMRGSHVEIKLDARNEDPDRIIRRTFDAVGKAVTRPSASSAVPTGRW